jgi:hypothetical protein
MSLKVGTSLESHLSMICPKRRVDNVASQDVALLVIRLNDRKDVTFVGHL